MAPQIYFVTFSGLFIFLLLPIALLFGKKLRLSGGCSYLRGGSIGITN